MDLSCRLATVVGKGGTGSYGGSEFQREIVEGSGSDKRFSSKSLQEKVDVRLAQVDAAGLVAF